MYSLFSKLFYFYNQIVQQDFELLNLAFCQKNYLVTSTMSNELFRTDRSIKLSD